MNRVVAYVRISSQSQIENTSIETQIEKIDLHCKLHDIEIVKIFKDEAKTAKNTERENYNKMIEFISDDENNIDAVICYKSDRVHRSLKNLLIFIEDILIPIKVGFVSITEQFDTSTAQGMLFLQMLGSFSEFERKIINERTKSGRISKGKNELFSGGRVPLGYNLINSDVLEINEEEAKIIKDIFKLRGNKKTMVEIGKKYGMSKQRIDYILKNQIYIGKYSYNGKKEQNKISLEVPRIISSYAWTKVHKTNCM